MSRRKDGSAGGFVAYADVLFNAFFFVFGMFVLQSLLPHLKAAEDAARQGITPGRLCVEMFYPDDLDADLDLWSRGPDGVIIGYSNRSGPLMDLLRDNLGKYMNPSGHNFETVCSRVLQAGEWTFNAHYYGSRDNPVPDDITVTLLVTWPLQDKTKPGNLPIKTTGVLHHRGDEITLIDFELDEHGIVIPSSVNSIDQPLRSKRPNQ